MDIIDNWLDEILRLDTQWAEDWEDWNDCLDQSQYSYVRLGLLLEKIRNTTYWKLAAGKFSSFREWCLVRMKLNIWQANSYIDAAQVATYLSNSTDGIPRNYSQAVALIPAYKAEEEYYGERPQLDRVWAEASKLKKVTADAIKRIFDPSIVEKESTKLSKIFLDKAKQAAAKQGLSLEEYLDRLIDSDNSEGAPVDSMPITPEQEAALDDLDRQWRSSQSPQYPATAIEPKQASIEPVKIIKSVGSSIDRMRAEMFDRYLPKWKREVSYG
jgi:hypothetical protein